ncbi:hypothetical protein Tco_0138601 [Tanacetum coccineum]
MDYVELLLDGLHYSLMHPTTLIPYLRFTNIIVDYYMTENPDISRRVHDNYHRVENDDLVKSIFNSRRNKEGDGMLIPDWMLTEEMKLTTHYKMFRVPRRLDPERPIPTTAEIDIDRFNEETQIKISTQRSLEDLEAQQNVEKVKEHMVDEEIEQLVEGELTVSAQDAPSSLDKEKLKELTVTYPTPSSPSPKPKTDRFRWYKTLQSTLKEVLPSWLIVESEIAKKTAPLYVAERLLLDRQKTQADVAELYVKQDSLCSPTQAAGSSAQDLQYQLYLKMKDDEQVRNADLPIWWSLKIKFEKPATSAAPCRTAVVRTIDHEDHHDDDARPERESREEHQYHVDQMQNYLKSDIVWESMKERLSLPTPTKPALVYYSCQRDLKAPPITLLNQDLFYLKYGNLGPKKYTLSLHKYPAIPFPKDDIKE